MQKVVVFALAGVIILTVGCNKATDSNGPVNCNGLVTDTLGTNDAARVYMPTAFTPNGDGLNDVIKPYTANVQSIDFTIYDAGNTVVFHTTQPGQGWASTVSGNSSAKYSYRIQAVTNANHHIGSCGDLYKLGCAPTNIASLHFEDQLTPNGFTGATAEHLAICP